MCKNCTEVSNILKKYNIKYRVDYIEIIQSLIETIDSLQTKINKFHECKENASPDIILYLGKLVDEELEII